MKTKQINNEKNDTEKNLQIPYKRILIGAGFIICSIIYGLFFPNQNILLYMMCGFFMLIGLVVLLYSIYEIVQYKRTGEVKIRTDERAELNALKASRKGFIFLAGSIAILMALWGFDIIDEKILAWLMGVAFAIGCIAYFLSYYMYEREDEKTNKLVLTVIEIGIGILIAVIIIIGPAIINYYIFPPIIKHASINNEVFYDQVISNQIERFGSEIFASPEVHGLILESRSYEHGTGKSTLDPPFSDAGETIHSDLWDVVEIYRINSTFYKNQDYDWYIIWVQAKGEMDNKPIRSLKIRVKINNGVITYWAPAATIKVEKNKEYELSLLKMQSGDNLLDIRQKYFMEQGKFGVYNLEGHEFEVKWEGKTIGEPYIILGAEVKVPKGEKPGILVDGRLFA